MSSTSAPTTNASVLARVPEVHLQLDNITYAPMMSLPASSGDKQERVRVRKKVLSNVSTEVFPGRLTAWMGPSGGGKSTLISVAAGLVNKKDLLDGSMIRVNGEEGGVPRRLLGIVHQDELLLSNLTVEETIFFSARLKTPAGVSTTEVHKIVERTMKDLGLLSVRDSLIGNGATGGRRGISGGERKRVSVATELVIRPSVLFLDEPTSGLDATSAQSLVETLKMLANNGHSVVLVIHQPRTAIFNLFDRLLLLSQGRVVYDGDSTDARQYLESCQGVGELPPETGIADWMMDSIAQDEASEVDTDNDQQESEGETNHNDDDEEEEEEDDDDPGTKSISGPSMDVGGSLPDLWTASVSGRRSGDDGKENALPGDRRLSLLELEMTEKYQSSVGTQLSLLMSRTLKQHRGERITAVAAVVTIAYTFFTSLFWWQIPDDTNFVFERNSLMFFILIAQANYVVVGSITTFQRERPLLRRERAKKLYQVFPYFVAKTLSDMTNNVLLPCAYGAVTYWATGLRPTAVHFVRFMLALYLSLSTAQSMGLFLSIAIPSLQVSLLLAPAVTLFFMILGGFYIPVNNINVAVRWATWVSFARYGYSAFVVNEFSGRDIPCATGEVAISIGVDGDCPVRGEEVLNSLGIEGVSGDFWFNIGMIVVLQIFFRTSSYILLRKHG